MTDLAKTIIPKSDQLNADDLIAGPRTITITAVKGCDNADQPVAVHFEGDDGKPYKPCKSMRRVMVHCWGPDGNTYTGRRITLFCDPAVVFGGIKVGGIRISHASHIERDLTMALTTTRASRKPYTVKPLRAEVAQAPRRDTAPKGQQTSGSAPPTLEQRAAAFLARVEAATTLEKLTAIGAAAAALKADLERNDPELLAECNLAFDAKLDALAPPENEDEDEAGGSPAGEGVAEREPPEAPLLPQETKAAVPAGMKRGSDLLAEMRTGQAAADPEPGDDDPLEWKAEAERYVEFAETIDVLKGLDAQWAAEGRWDRLKRASKADFDDLVRKMGARDRELRREESR